MKAWNKFSSRAYGVWKKGDSITFQLDTDQKIMKKNGEVVFKNDGLRLAVGYNEDEIVWYPFIFACER